MKRTIRQDKPEQDERDIGDLYRSLTTLSRQTHAQDSIIAELRRVVENHSRSLKGLADMVHQLNVLVTMPGMPKEQ